MSSDRKEFLGNLPEPPPPYSGDVKLWAEDVDNYLRRRFQAIEERLARIEETTKSRLNSGSN